MEISFSPHMEVTDVERQDVESPSVLIRLQEGTLGERMAKQYTCPICDKVLYPPIRQCHSGHNFCGNCFKDFTRCPLCRCGKSESRCYILEKVHALLKFPCRFKFQGCEFTGKTEEMKTHEDRCNYSLTVCPLRVCNCPWLGKLSELKNHSQISHPGMFLYGSRQKMVIKRFNILLNRSENVILKAFNNHFRFSWHMDVHTLSMKFAVYIVGDPVTTRFAYEIAFLFENTDREIITLKGPCYEIRRDTQIFVDTKYVATSYDMVCKYCDAAGNFNFMVKIIF